MSLNDGPRTALTTEALPSQGKEHPTRAAPAVALESLLRKLVPWAALLTFVLWVPLISAPRHSWDDADPEVLNNAYRLSLGQPLYHGTVSPPWAVSPYTPLYTLLTAAALRLTGLSFVPARFVSVLATLSLGVALGLLARRWLGRAREGLAGACLLLLVPSVLYNSARPHPQMLATAFSVWSFALSGGAPGLVRDLLSPLLAVLGVYTKQSQIALPLGMAMWLAWREPGRLPRYVGIVAVLGLGPVPWLQHVTHGAFLDSVVGLNFLPYDGWWIAPVLVEHAGILFPFLGLALARLALRARGGSLEPLDFYLLGVALVTIPSLGRVGAHGQYVVELEVVTVLYLLRTGGLAFPRGREAWTAFQLAVLLLYGPLFVLLQEGPSDRASLAAAPSVRALLETVPGPVISQQGSFPLFTRGEIHVQLFHFMGLTRMGRWDEGPLLREVEERRVAWVVTESALEDPLETRPDRERFSPELREALARNYTRRAQLGPYYVYGPREGSSSLRGEP